MYHYLQTCIIFSWAVVRSESEIVRLFCHPFEVQYKLSQENKRPDTTNFLKLGMVSNTAYTYGVAPGAHYIQIKQAHHSCTAFLQYKPVKPPSLLFPSNFQASWSKGDNHKQEHTSLPPGNRLQLSSLFLKTFILWSCKSRAMTHPQQMTALSSVPSLIPSYGMHFRIS